MLAPRNSTDILREVGIDPSRLDYGRAALVGAGFTGFVSFNQLETASTAPVDSGVYVVLYDCSEAFQFVHPSPGGWFKGRDPTCSEVKLRANWLPGAGAVYIGKATNLRARLRQFAQFGAGKAIGHSGGRLIWQLPDSNALKVAWKITPRHDPEAVEAALLRQFFPEVRENSVRERSG